MTAGSRATGRARRTGTAPRRAGRGLAYPDPVPRLLVDASNVMGSRPDGWWRDRTGARIRLTVELDEAADTVCARLLGDRRADVVVVHDGRPIEMQLLRVHVRFAGHADDLLVDLAAPGDVVVTSDRELARRVEASGATTVGSGTLVRLLRDAAVAGTPRRDVAGE